MSTPSLPIGRRQIGRGHPRYTITEPSANHDTMLKWRKDDRKSVRIYSEAARRYGLDVRTLGWGSRASQLKRFEVLAGIGDLTGCRVLDVGCGLADFYAWLRERGTRVRYTGLDVTPDLLAMARRRYPRLTFFECGILDANAPKLGQFDYVFASGIFAHRRTAPVRFLHAAVNRMFSLAARGVAFNSLSKWAEQRDPGEFHACPVRTFEACRNFTGRLVLRHDYHPRDFTVYLYREESK